MLTEWNIGVITRMLRNPNTEGNNLSNPSGTIMVASEKWTCFGLSRFQESFFHHLFNHTSDFFGAGFKTQYFWLYDIVCGGISSRTDPFPV